MNPDKIADEVVRNYYFPLNGGIPQTPYEHGLLRTQVPLIAEAIRQACASCPLKLGEYLIDSTP